MFSLTFLKNRYFSSFMLPNMILFQDKLYTFVPVINSTVYHGKKKEIIAGEISD